MKKLLLSIAALIINILQLLQANAQKPLISYPGPQTVYIGKPVSAITVKNTGGAVPPHFNLQTANISVSGIGVI